MYFINEGSWDRAFRVTVGAILMYLGLFAATGIWTFLLGIIGILFLVTGLTGFCPLYKFLGISTDKPSRLHKM